MHYDKFTPNGMSYCFCPFFFQKWRAVYNFVYKDFWYDAGFYELAGRYPCACAKVTNTQVCTYLRSDIVQSRSALKFSKSPVSGYQSFCPEVKRPGLVADHTAIFAFMTCTGTALPFYLLFLLAFESYR